MFDPLLAADAGFRPAWDEFVAEWQDTRTPPLYEALGSLAGHLLGRLRRGELDGDDRVFAVIEAWLTTGDAYVVEAAVVGLLESLQTLSRTCDAAIAVEPFLGPASTDWWHRLDRFWAGDATALRFDT